MKVVFADVITCLLLFVTCEKENDNPNIIPDALVGSWIRTFEGNRDYQRIIIGKQSETTGSIEHYWVSEEVIENEFVILFAARGDLTVNGRTGYIRYKEIGSEYPVYLGGPEVLSDTTVWYDETHEYFIEYASHMESNTSSFEFDIDGNKLTLYMDDNSDGDFNDEDEIVILTKEP